MKTTLTQKVDNYLETNHGIVTILGSIGALIVSLFALGMAHDYSISLVTSATVVAFLMVFGAFLGAFGAYIIAEKIGYANSAKVSRSLHKHYNGELEKAQAELALVRAENKVLAHSADYADLAYSHKQLTSLYELVKTERDNLREVLPMRDKQIEKLSAVIETRDYDIVKLRDGAYHMAWALCEDGDLREDAFTTLKALLTTEPHKRAQAFADTEIAFYASVENDGHETPSQDNYTASASTALLIGTLDRAYVVNGETRYPLA